MHAIFRPLVVLLLHTK